MNTAYNLLGAVNQKAATHAGVVLVRHGIRFGFLGYTFDQQNGNWHDVDTAHCHGGSGRSATGCRGTSVERCDVVIVSMHSGIEYKPRPSQKQIDFAHAAIDAGATLVIGHHPHVVQPREMYRGREIYYSLGNFVFDQFQRERNPAWGDGGDDLFSERTRSRQSGYCRCGSHRQGPNWSRCAQPPEGNSTCPPNFDRIADKTFSANVCSVRERNRVNSAEARTSTATASSMAALMVQRPSPESSTTPV